MFTYLLTYSCTCRAQEGEVELGLRVGLLLLQLFANGGDTDIVFVTLFCITVGTLP